MSGNWKSLALTFVVMLALTAPALAGNDVSGVVGSALGLGDFSLVDEAEAQCHTRPAIVGNTKVAELQNYVDLFVGLVHQHGLSSPHMLGAMIDNHLRVLEMPNGSDLHTKLLSILAPRGLSLSMNDEGDMVAFVNEMATCASQNPYLLKFLKTLWGSDEASQAYTLFTDRERALTIAEALTYAFVLDRLTKAVRYLPTVLVPMKEVFAAKIDSIQRDKYFESTLGPLMDSVLAKMKVFDKMMDHNLVSPPHTNTFEKVKKYGIDLGIDGILESTDSRVDHTGDSQGGFRLGLPINILEAVVEDYRLGNFDNGDSGMSMVYNGVEQKPYCKALGNERGRVSDDGNAVWLFPYLPKQFADIYSTWNMAFVSHYGNAPQFYGKLFNPQVLCYEDKPQEYLHNRIVSLWLHIYFELFSRNDRGTRDLDQDWSNLGITRLWSKVNAESGAEYSTMVDNCKAACVEDDDWKEPSTLDFKLLADGALRARAHFHGQYTSTSNVLNDVRDHVDRLKQEHQTEQEAVSDLPGPVKNWANRNPAAAEEMAARYRGKTVLRGAELKARTAEHYGRDDMIDKMKANMEKNGGHWMTEERSRKRVETLEMDALSRASSSDSKFDTDAENPQNASAESFDAPLEYGHDAEKSGLASDNDVSEPVLSDSTL